MQDATLTIAMIHDVFADPDGEKRLAARLLQARDGGAELAVLPELPLNPWSPASRTPRNEDAEKPEGPRHDAHLAAYRRLTHPREMGSLFKVIGIVPSQAPFPPGLER